MFEKSDFAVICAVNDDAILEACLLRSPDIVSGDLQLVSISGAPNMAAAYNQGLDISSARVCLFAHQDVYLPAGWLGSAIKALGELSNSHPEWRVAGPYGVTAEGLHVGRVWDVTLGRELGGGGFAPTPIWSLDELLLIVRREEPFQFDPELPHFHLYGTDIVQVFLSKGYTAWAVELPVVHNNRPIASLRGGYSDAYKYVRRKWKEILPIHTSICAITYNPFHLWRAQFRRRNVFMRPDNLLADSVEISKLSGYE